MKIIKAKIVKKVALWAFISLVFQWSILFYLDRYYFSAETNVKIDKVDTNKIAANKGGTDKGVKPKIEMKLPQNAANLNFSYDGRYVSYYENNNIMVLNTADGSSDTIKPEEKSTQFYHTWIAERNRITIAEKQTIKDKNVVKLYFYDPKSKVKEEVKDYISNKEVFLTLPTKDAFVKKIEFNTNNTISYIKISVNEKMSYLYRFDASAPIESVATQSKAIGEYNVIRVLDKVIYEDLVNSKIYFSKDKVPVSIDGVSKYALLSADNDGKVYVGEVEEGKIKSIYYGAAADKPDKWQAVRLKEPANRKDIFVTLEGRIFINDSMAGTAVDIKNAKEYRYEGRLLAVNDRGFMTVRGGDTLLMFEIK